MDDGQRLCRAFRVNPNIADLTDPTIYLIRLIDRSVGENNSQNHKFTCNLSVEAANPRKIPRLPCSVTKCCGRQPTPAALGFVVKIYDLD